MKHADKTMLLVAGIIILIAVAITAFIYGRSSVGTIQLPVTTTKITKSVDSATKQNYQWSEYSNVKDEYTLSYPTSLFVYKDPMVDFWVSTSKPEGGNGPKFLGQNDVWLEITVLPTRTASLDSYLDSPGIHTQITVDGVKALKIETTEGLFAAGGTSKTVYEINVLAIKYSKLYSLKFLAFNKSVLDNHRDLFDQILSTFRFTN